MKMTRTRRLVVATAAVVGGLTTSLGTASAAPQGYEQVEVQEAHFYGNHADTVINAGGTMADRCTGDVASYPMRVHERADGSVDLMIDAEEVAIHVYRYEGPAPALLQETCAALADGDPSTEPLAPYAAGTANLRLRNSISPDGVVEIFNGVNGTARTVDGSRLKVRAWADLVVEDGVLITDPAEGVDAVVTEIGG